MGCLFVRFSCRTSPIKDASERADRRRGRGLKGDRFRPFLGRIQAPGKGTGVLSMKNYARGKSFHTKTRTFRPKTRERRGRSRQRSRGLPRRATPLPQRGGRGCGERANHIRAGLPEALPSSFLHENETIFLAEASAEGKEGISRRFLQQIPCRKAYKRAQSSRMSRCSRAGEGRPTGGEVAPIATVCRSIFVVSGSFLRASA